MFSIAVFLSWLCLVPRLYLGIGSWGICTSYCNFFNQSNITNYGNNNIDGGWGGGLYRYHSEVRSMSGSGGIFGGKVEFEYAEKK